VNQTAGGQHPTLCGDECRKGEYGYAHTSQIIQVHIFFSLIIVIVYLLYILFNKNVYISYIYLYHSYTISRTQPGDSTRFGVFPQKTIDWRDGRRKLARASTQRWRSQRQDSWWHLQATTPGRHESK
ncbi:MAG: hypothetical protein R3212_05910, partial [Xanthomonadales bacterium]|nr:hypothetical protein [Xanthomonadales bacterium]